MKNTFFLIAVLLLSGHSANSQNIKQSYIEIRHTGAESKHIKSLLISTEKLNITPPKKIAELLSEEAKTLSFDTTKKYSKKQQTEEWLNIRYDRLLTDKKTFSEITNFVTDHPSFLTSSTQKNLGGDNDYTIIINHKTYNIYYKLLSKYFGELINDLTKEKCDNRIIQKLKFYSQ